MRLFFALWPPASAARALAQWARDVQRATSGNPTREDKIHLTLAFLGDADPERAIAAGRRVRAAAHVLPIEEWRYVRRNNMVWVGPRETPAPLLALFRGLRAELEQESFALERRPFAAHVTLVRKARASGSLPPLPAVEWPVTEFRLVRSSLSAAGATYETLETFGR